MGQSSRRVRTRSLDRKGGRPASFPNSGLGTGMSTKLRLCVAGVSGKQSLPCRCVPKPEFGNENGAVFDLLSVRPHLSLEKEVIMEKTYGWTGSLLRIGLPSGEFNKTQSMDYAEDFIGGRLLASRIYWDEVSKDTRALDPDNVLMFMPGPLTGTQAIGCSRWVISAKSPHSFPDQYGFGNGGGFFGAALKRSGFDGLIIRGKAKALSYILLENEKVEMKNAGGLRTLETEETMKKLREEHGSDVRIVCVGPAGENLVRFAIARTDQGGTLSNGMGAVMGSKNIKAMVIKGGSKVPVALPDKLSEVNKHIRFLRKGQNESLYLTEPMIQGIDKGKYTPCYGCPGGCSRAFFKHTSGREEIRKTCASAFLYTPWASSSPKPSCLTIRSTRASINSRLPILERGRPVSSSVSAPCLKHS